MDASPQPVSSSYSNLGWSSFGLPEFAASYIKSIASTNLALYDLRNSGGYQIGSAIRDILLSGECST